MTWLYEQINKPVTLTVHEGQALYRVARGVGRKGDKAQLIKALERNMEMAIL